MCIGHNYLVNRLQRRLIYFITAGVASKNEDVTPFTKSWGLAAERNGAYDRMIDIFEPVLELSKTNGKILENLDPRNIVLCEERI